MVAEPFDVTKLSATQDVILKPVPPGTPAPPPPPRMTFDADAEVARVLKEKPNKFTVSGFTDGQGGLAKLSFNRTWKNGWGATAYAKAWWNDASVTAERSSGVAVGGEGTYTFGDR